MARADLPSAPDLELGIHAALRAEDMPAVVGLLPLLTVQDPKRAELLYQTIRVGLAITQERGNTNNEENQ
jgi:hypothetical protein